MSFAVKSKSGTVTTWHVPGPSPIPQDQINDIEWLQADGDEYEDIRHKFSYGVAPFISTIPLARGNIARWYGDIAKTILFNL